MHRHESDFVYQFRAIGEDISQSPNKSDLLPVFSTFTKRKSMSFQPGEFVSPLESLVFDTYLDTAQSDRDAAEELALWVCSLLFVSYEKAWRHSKIITIISEQCAIHF